MWADCYEAFVNIDKLDYISFNYDGNIPTAYLFFTGRETPLKLQSDSLEEMVKYFAGITSIAVEKSL